jgi:hypothetical protein
MLIPGYCTSAFGFRQLQQLSGHYRQAAQGFLNLGHTVLQLIILYPGFQSLHLGERCRQGCAQFMGAVGGKTPLCLKSTVQSFQQPIDGQADRLKFPW